MSFDFEIESPVQRKGSKYLGGFGGGGDDDDVYNYEVTQIISNGAKKGTTSSYQKSPLKGSDRGSRTVSKSTNALYSNSNDVMDKAAMMLAKYNNVSKSVDASSNQHLSRNTSKSFNKLPSRFDEDELSISSGDDDENGDEEDDNDDEDDSNDYDLSTSLSQNSKIKSVNAKSKGITKPTFIADSSISKKATTVQPSSRRSEVFGNVQSINDLEQSISMDESEAYNSSLNLSNSYSRPSPVSAEKHIPEDTIIDEEYEDDINDRYGIVANEPSSDTIEEVPADEPEAPKIVSFADIGQVTGWNAAVEAETKTKPAVAPAKQTIQPVYSENEPTAANRYSKPTNQDTSSSNPTPYSSYPQHPIPPMPHPSHSQEMPPYYGHPGYIPYPYHPNPMSFSVPNYFGGHPLHNMMSSSIPGPLIYPNPMMSMAQSSNYNSSDPVIIDLLRELKQAKEDAAWAKSRLAEMISLVNKNKSNKRAPSPYEEYSEYEEEYSNDFESSVLNTSQDTTKKEKESNRKSNNSPHSNKAQPIQTHPVMPTPYYQESVLRMNSTLATSQEMFRKQLTSLRDRVNTINSNQSAFNPSVNRSNTTFKAAPTLQELKKQFELKRIENNKKLVELLMQQDPSLSEVQAKRLASGY